MRSKWLRIVASAVALGIIGVGVAKADVLDDIKKKGTLIVGTKADYRPFGYLDPSGKIIGFEPDLAADVAKRLGVKLELVPVVASNRIQFLQQGKIDLMIATMSDTPERRKTVDIIDPDYYASGTNVLAKKSEGLKSWDQLKGKKVCLIQGVVLQQGAAGEIRDRRRCVSRHGRGVCGAAQRQLRRVRVRRHGDRRRDAEARVERLRNAARVDPAAAVGPRRQDRARRPSATSWPRPSPTGTRPASSSSSRRSTASSRRSSRRTCTSKYK